jgi:hypothetical protein
MALWETQLLAVKTPKMFLAYHHLAVADARFN